MHELPDCLYCRNDHRLHDLMIEIAPLGVSTLYLFREQTYRGRCVVAYSHHVNELYELPEPQLSLFSRDVARAARAIREAMSAAKINYGAYSDKLPHLHVHLVPKYPDAADWGVPFRMMPEPRQLLTVEAYTALAAGIRARLT